MKSCSFCLTVVRCLWWWWCMYRKMILKQIVEDWVVGTVVYYKMDSVCRFLDDHDETWGCVLADSLLNNRIRTDCSRNVLYQIISHSLNLSVNQYVIRSFSYPANQFVRQRQPSQPASLSYKPANQVAVQTQVSPLTQLPVKKSVISGSYPVLPLSVLSYCGVLVALSVRVSEVLMKPIFPVT
jgi:hypothetical protein